MRKRTIKPGLLEELVRALADSLTPDATGPRFSWRGAFPGMACDFARTQLFLGYFKVYPHHEAELKEISARVAEEMALADPARADPT